MKQKLNKIKLFLFSCISIAFFSCEKDLYENAIPNNKTIIREIKFNDLYKEQKFKNLLEIVSNNKTISKNFFNNSEDFILSDQNVKVIETDSITSYTMLIKRKNSNDTSYFENLVIQRDLFNKESAFIIKYVPYEIRSDVAHNSFSFTGRIFKSKYLKKSSNKSSFSRQAQSTCSVDVLMCYESRSGGAGSSHTAGSECKNIRYLYVTTVEALCADYVPAGGGGSYGTPSSPYPPSTGGGGGGGDGSLDPSYMPPGDNTYQQPGYGYTEPGLVDANGNVLTSPVMPIASALNTFEENLSTDRVNWWRDNNNVDKVNSIKNYLNDNTIHGNINQETSIFAENLIDLMIQDPTITSENIENWFLTPNEGQDGELEPTLNEDMNNIVYQTMAKPTYSSFVNSFPKLPYPGYPGYFTTMPAKAVYNIVGGNLKSLYIDNGGDNGAYKNACAIRWSYAMNKAGIKIPKNKITRQGLNFNGIEQNYFILAVSAADFMQKTFRDADSKLEGAKANNPAEIAKFLKGKFGIYVIINNDFSQANYTGHIDLIQNGHIPGGSNSLNVPGGIKYIKIWSLNN